MADQNEGTTGRPPLRFGVVHDFRCPPGSSYSLQDVYAQTLEQIRLLDGLGLDLVWFTEHHFVEDSYLPSFVPVAAATAAVTQHVRISTDIALAPFYHPLRLAEDMAILDQLSGGRMELGLGLGYAPHEFRTFGIPVSRRVSLTEECADILRLAWTGERFSYSGKRYQFDDVLVTPAPVQPGGPPLWMATTSPKSVDRAVRYDSHVLPQGVRELVLDRWRDKSREAGHDPDSHRIGIIRGVFVTDDPEKEWPPLRESERYRMRVYGRFFEEAGQGGKQVFLTEGRISQNVIIGDVDTCAAELTEFIVEHGFTDVVTWGSSPALPPEVLTPHMERFAREVVPRVREAVAARSA
jgi:alkanesulfonate monooxygenase SsuD/methylene tetrahydromethanopterin reductase-like flavin-dependent oxidoreductase (luciferase family)